MDVQKSGKKPNYTKHQVYVKAESFCAYQERSQQEVRNKLYDWGLHSSEVEDIITDLITNNFLNEERFARAYVLGRFRIKKWGRIKIKQGLKLKKVSPRLIKEALEQIEPDEYINELETLMKKKSRILSEKEPFKRKMKLANFAAMRGFENELIFDILNNKDL